MLSYELLGAAALAIFWMNIVLMVGSLFQRARAARRMAHRLNGWDGTLLLRGHAPKAMAEFSVRQVGRAADGRLPRILFHDLERSDRILGGPFETENGEIEIRPASVPVWLSRREIQSVMALRPESFQEDYELSLRPEGFSLKRSEVFGG